jgi:hypothetical protein
VSFICRLSLTDFITVMPFQGIKMFSLPCRYHIQSTTCGSICVTRVQYVVRISGVTVVASGVRNVLFIPKALFSSKICRWRELGAPLSTCSRCMISTDRSEL